MNSAVLTLLSISISGSILAIVLFSIKPLLKHRVSKAFSYYIWLVVLLRLALPFAAPVNAMDVIFSNANDVMQTTQAASDTQEADAFTPGINGEKAVTPEYNSQAEFQSVDAKRTYSPALSAPGFDLWAFIKGNIQWIWAVGALCSFAWFVIAYLRFYRHIKKMNTRPRSGDEAVFNTVRGNRRVRLAYNQYVKTPMLIGLVSPVIVIPQLAYVRNGMSIKLKNILRHELTHYKRKDLIYKWLTVAVTSLHWFNPLMIFLRREISRACELSCDEAVIRDMTDDEKQSYGDTLLALSTSRRPPVGILATTLCEKKSELKERLISIMKYKKKTIWAVILSVILALALTGCSVALGAATTQTEEVQTNDMAQKPAIIDFDGDGLADSASIQAENNEYAKLTVALGNGEVIEKKYDGWWWPQDAVTGNSDASGNPIEAQAGDFDEDGNADILISLLYGGSSGENRVVHVLYLENGELSEYPTNYVESNVSFDIDKELLDFGADCMGVWPVSSDTGTFLRIREYTPEMAESDSALYFDVAWNGDGWLIQSVNTGKAYSYEVDEAAQAVAPSQTLPILTRDGFGEAQITIIEQPEVEWTDDGDHDPTMIDGPLTEEIAKIALRQLYNMTGIQIQKCYAQGTESHVAFSMDGTDFNHKCFYSADFDDGICTGMLIAYQTDVIDYSPIDPANVIKPADDAGMTDAQKAQWYYENSSFGDRRVIVSAIEDSPYDAVVSLVVDDGNFYEVTFNDNTGLPQTFVGPVNQN